MEEIKKKRGRPPKDVSRKCQVNVLFTKDEFDDLKDGIELSGETQSDIVRNGTKLYLELIRARGLGDGLRQGLDGDGSDSLRVGSDDLREDLDDFEFFDTYNNDL